ncbi:hypothetical protein [Leptospira yasudae]|uniref:hypothetical protein n=1 Tax=Leptospira yasudae TaxID=2202201 RepID=UPI00299034C1|nr:hypothetical protein [Leptospira yasudae]
MIADQAAAEEAAKRQEEGNQHQGAAAIAGAGVREERDFLDDAMDWAGDKVDGAIDSVVGATSSAWNGVKNVASAAWDGVKGAASAVWNGAVNGITAVGNAASNAWNATKNAVLGPDKVVMMPAMGGSMQPLYHENVGDGAAYGASSSRGESASDRHLRVGEDAISNYLDKQRSENPYLRKGKVGDGTYNEFDVSLHPDYHKRLVDMELRNGISGGNLILDKLSGSLFYRTKATGMTTEIVPTNPNDRAKAPWTLVEPHTDKANGIYSGDFSAKRSSHTSVWGPNGGTFMITEITKSQMGGNQITTETTINGVFLQQKHRHLENQIPDIAYQAYKSKTPLPYGTPIGNVGMTGNMKVNIINDVNNPMHGQFTAPVPHEHQEVAGGDKHKGFIKGVTFGPEARQAQGLPPFDYDKYYRDQAKAAEEALKKKGAKK